MPTATALPPTVWSDLEDAYDCLFDTEDELENLDSDDATINACRQGLATLRVILGAANEARTAEELAEVFVAHHLVTP